MLGTRYSAEDDKAVVRRVSESEQSVVRVSIIVAICRLDIAIYMGRLAVHRWRNINPPVRT